MRFHQISSTSFDYSDFLETSPSVEERGRWLVKIQYQMRGLDVHMDDNIGRRLNALFDILTTVASADGEQQNSGCTGGGGGGEVEAEAGNDAVDECSSFQPNLSIDDEADAVFPSSRTKALDYPILPLEWVARSLLKCAASSLISSICTWSSY